MRHPAMTNVSTYLRRGGIALVAIGVGGFAAHYAFDVVVSRLLEVHEFGDFKVARAFAAFFGAAVLLGGDRAAPKALSGPLEAGEPSKATEYLRFYLRLGVGLSLVVIAGTWLGTYLHSGSTDPRHHHAVAWLALIVPLHAVGALASRALQSVRRPVLAALPWRMGIQTLLLAVLAALALSGVPVTLHTVLVLVVACVLLVAAWQWRMARRLALPTWLRDPAEAQPREWLLTSLPMMGVFLVTMTLGQSDLYFLEILGDERDVGFYAAADTTAHFLVLIQTTVVGLVAPLVQPAIEAGPLASRRTRRDGLRLMLAGLVPTALLLAFAARPALSLFGNEYGSAVPELHFLLVGNFAFATAALAALWLQYTGRGTHVVVIAAGTLLLDSALNLLLIPTYGMLGAAASTAGTLTLAAVALVLAERRGSAPGDPTTV